MKTGSQRDTCAPTFTTALITVAPIQKQPKGPSMDEWIKKDVMYVTHTHTQIYTIEYLLFSPRK